MAFGVTPEGFVRPSVQEIKGEIERDELAGIDPTLDVATDPVVGQINGIVAQQLGKAWEALEAAYDAFDPDRAEDDRLRSLSKLTGTEPQGASKTVVACTIALAAGVTLEAGVHFANVQDKPDIRFTPKQSYTSPADGLHTDVLFECEQFGPIIVLPSSLKVIATPVVGWDSIINPEEGDTGHNADGNPELRERRERELAQRGSATKDAIEAAVSAVDGVVQVHVSENRTDEINNSGLAPHSVEVIVFGAAADDDEIAQAIWDNKSAGIRDFSGAGNANQAGGTAFDKQGGPHVVIFTRAIEVPIFVDFNLSTGPDYVGDVTFKLAIATLANRLYNVDDTVIASRVRSLPFEKNVELDDGTLIAALGVVDVVDFDIGTSASPTLEQNIPINTRQVARFDSGRIVVT